MSSTYGQRESNYPQKRDMDATDLIRTVIGGQSTNMRPEDLADVLAPYIDDSVAKVKVRTVGADGQISVSDNVVLTEGTSSQTMPNPSEMYDSSESSSVEITIAQKTSGTVTILPYATAQFRDGSGGSPHSSLSLTSGSTVSLVADGVDYIVTSS